MVEHHIAPCGSKLLSFFTNLETTIDTTVQISYCLVDTKLLEDQKKIHGLIVSRQYQINPLRWPFTQVYNLVNILQLKFSTGKVNQIPLLARTQSTAPNMMLTSLM